MSGEGSYDYGFRAYDAGLARFFSVDPLREKYPELTPYQFGSNTPIQAVDLDGKEAFFIHGTMGNAGDWSYKQMKEITNKFTNNTDYTGKFSWSGKAGILNNERDRNDAAKSLINYIMDYRVKNNITDQEISIVGFSHGGNVAIQAAQMLYDSYGVQANIITVNTPAFNGYGDIENPSNNTGINDILSFNTKYDGVAGQIAPGSDDSYDSHGFLPIKNFTLPQPAGTGFINAHFLKNVSPSKMTQTDAPKLEPVYEGLKNPVPKK